MNSYWKVIAALLCLAELGLAELGLAELGLAELGSWAHAQGHGRDAFYVCRAEGDVSFESFGLRVKADWIEIERGNTICRLERDSEFRPTRKADTQGFIPTEDSVTDCKTVMRNAFPNTPGSLGYAMLETRLLESAPQGMVTVTLGAIRSYGVERQEKFSCTATD